ncbi:hypothetical protein GCM10010400_41990 [Streptomyces aculeolatus]
MTGPGDDQFLGVLLDRIEGVGEGGAQLSDTHCLHDVHDNVQECSGESDGCRRCHAIDEDYG